MKRSVIIGAGVGGLTSAIRLAQNGWRVVVIESREVPGGLAASLEIEGFRFDAGPYILLDRLGLEWAFRQARVEIAQLDLQRIKDVYETDLGEKSFRVIDSLDDTVVGIEKDWPGCGELYRRFVSQMQARYARLQPFQCAARPGIFELVRSGAWRDIPFLFRSLGSVLADARLPASLAAAVGIWTHVAGQSLSEAPSPLALAPGVIHGVGSYYPRNGIGTIPDALFVAAKNAGVEFRFGVKVKKIRCQRAVAQGVELTGGEFIAADAVISNVGIGTYLHLLDDDGRAAIPPRLWVNIMALPLQSPGVCAYLAVKGRAEPPYLRFQIRDEPDGCRLLVTPSVLTPEISRDGWSPARLIAPMNHARAESDGEEGQKAFLAKVLGEVWWRRHFEEVRVLATRIPSQWGAAYQLFLNSMNPVMTAKFMRAGRLAHRSPGIRGLYLTGSATHPGQWVSFCAVSGVLTADCVLSDWRR
jgi:phytoene desaturase